MPLLERRGRGTICVTCPKIQSKARKYAKNKRLEEREALEKVNYVDVEDMITETGIIDGYLTKNERDVVENKIQPSESSALRALPTRRIFLPDITCSITSNDHIFYQDRYCNAIEGKVKWPNIEHGTSLENIGEDPTNYTRKAIENEEASSSKNIKEFHILGG